MTRKRVASILVVVFALLLTTGGATGQEPDSEGEALLQGDVSIAGTVRSRISYQGRLQEDDVPVTGSRDMRFRLFSDDSCTAQLGSNIVKNGVTVTDGLFSVELDVSHWDFNGQGLWLEVAVGGTAMGCQEVLPVPYALSLRPGAMIDDTASTLYLNRYRTSPAPFFDTHKYGIQAVADGNFDFAYGVSGIAHSPRLGGGAYGLYGSASATGTSGTAYGVYGITENNDPLSAGVYGDGATQGVRGTGITYGVYGETSAGVAGVRGYHDGSGTGVWGVAGATGGMSYGVRGTSPSSTGGSSGVFGNSIATSGQVYGVRGESESSVGAGVYGTAPKYGVRGESESPAGTGVYGFASGEGVLGESSASGGYGVRGKNTSDGIGVSGSSYSGIGVVGLGGNGVGVRGEGLDGGVIGEIWSNAAGVLGIANINHGATYGVRGESPSGNDDGYGGYFVGYNAVRAQANHANGIALWAESDSTDATLVLRNDGTGDLIRGFSHDDWELRFRVANDGRTTVPVLAITGGSDLSEQFDVTATKGEVTPGLAVCIDANQPGKLLVCNGAYDRTVAGILSGAGGIEPGMVMGQGGSPADGAYPVALTGRVYAWADASAGPIQPGDLLTTSDTPGSVMRVSDYARAQGAIIGKAMTSLKEGQGLILVLVTLQ